MAPKSPAKGKVPAPAPVIEEGDETAGYPCAKYKKNTKQPNGYDVKRVETPEDAEKLGPEWKDSPADF